MLLDAVSSPTHQRPHKHNLAQHSGQWKLPNLEDEANHPFILITPPDGIRQVDVVDIRRRWAEDNLTVSSTDNQVSAEQKIRMIGQE